MDELTPLRELRDDVAGPDADAITRARVLLNERILTEESARRAESPATGPAVVPAPKRRFRLRSIGMSLAAAAVVGGVALTAVGLPGTGASAEAAEVLDHAAAATIGQSDPVVGPGQYLRIDTVGTVAGNVGRTVGDHSEWLQWIDSDRTTLYVPHDADDEWVLQNGVRKPIEFFSDASKTWAEKHYQQEVAAHPDGETYRAQNGAFDGGRPAPTPEALAALPRDPKALLDHFRAEAKQADAPVDEESFTLIADLLRSGRVPADLRAALYRSLERIPGVTRTDGTTTLDGRSGVAIGRDARDERNEIVIDPETGEMIGERSVLTEAREAMPAGTVTESNAVTRTVVDEAP